MDPEEEVFHLGRSGVLDACEIGLDRLDAELIASYGIHALLIDSGDFESIGSGSRILCRKAGNDTFHAVVARIVQDVELSIARILRRQRMRFHPFFIHMVVEIGLWRNGIVDARGVQTFQMLLSHRSRKSDAQRSKC